MPVVEELERRGWLNKRWVTRKGQVRGGRPFTKTSLHKLLTNVAYSGRVKYKNEVHHGEHPAIIDGGALAPSANRIALPWPNQRRSGP